VEGAKIYTARSNTTEVTRLFEHLYEQYSHVFRNYVFRGEIPQNPVTIRNRADVINAYLFHENTIATPVAGGSCDYQNFRNKIVIPTMLHAYNSKMPIIMLPGIVGDAELQHQYFTEPNPVEMEKNKDYQLALGV